MKDWDINDKKYSNIDNIETLEDGSANLFLKEGRRAIVKVIKAGDKFEAAIYRMVYGEVMEPVGKERKSIFGELGNHTAYNDCMREAIGWVDENKEQFPLPEFKDPTKQ